MAGTEIEKPSRLAQIPTAPGIKLENLIQFDGDCIDPVALVIITEALDYALESSARRLSSLGKIFSGVEETAYNSGKGVLPTIKAIREAILFAPQCTPEGPRVMPPPTSVEEAIVTEAKRRTVTQAKPKVKPKEEPAPKARKQPGFWGEASFESKKYESPQVLAKEVGIITRGAKDMAVAFKRAGFEVRGDGEEVKKGETGFIVRRTGPTPEKYKIPIVEEEKAPPKKAKEPPRPWVKVMKEGKLVRWEDAEGKPIPKELWPE